MSIEGNNLDANLDFSLLQEKVREIEKTWRNIDKQFPLLDYDSIYSSLAAHSVDPDPIIPEGYFEKTQEYQEKSLEMLQAINRNTANLYSIVDLIKNSNEKQDDVIELLSDIFLLAKAKTKEEVDGMFKTLTKKINDTADTVESIMKLTSWAMAVYNMVLPFINQ